MEGVACPCGLGLGLRFGSHRQHGIPTRSQRANLQTFAGKSAGRVLCFNIARTKCSRYEGLVGGRLTRLAEMSRRTSDAKKDVGRLYHGRVHGLR